MDDRLAPRNAALQHGRAPRPLPLFLELVREAARADAATARLALEGLGQYERATRAVRPSERPVVATSGPTVLRDHGGSGEPVVLVPSLINPPRILDLPGRSLAAALATRHRVLLVDWGPAGERLGLDLGAHVGQLLCPLIEAVTEPVALIGYCLGGTMALAAANLVPVRKVATLAAPWSFDAYPAESIAKLGRLWRYAEPLSRRMSVLPTEVLQAAFWSIDPMRIVGKFAALARQGESSAALGRFVTLEDWANEGEPVPYPAAVELIESLFLRNSTGIGSWRIDGRLIQPDPAPTCHFTAQGDRIVPEASAPPGPVRPVHAGHVGMVVGGRAPTQLHEPLLRFLADQPDRGAAPDREPRND